MNRLPPLNALRVFESAARHLSFKKASEELAVTPAAVSHQIKLLEEHLGVSLFRRLTRSLELTSPGEILLPKVREGFDCFLAGTDRVRQRELNGPLTVVAPPTFASYWLIPRLASFSADYPSITLHLISSPGTVDSRRNTDVTDQSIHDLPDERADFVVIRYGTGNYPGYHVDQLIRADYIPVCSPSLLASGKPLREPTDLRFHTLLHDNTIVEGGAKQAWDEWFRIAGTVDIDASVGPHFSNFVLTLSAAIDGLGVALAPRPLVAREIQAGRLLSPFDLELGFHYAYYLLVPEQKSKSTSVISFRNWILKAREER